MSSGRLEGIFPRRPFPQVCVWEVTLACNARCAHCGSRAGPPREGELSTQEACVLVGELAELGCECVTLSGGEPLLRADWSELAAVIRTRGMQTELITNGLLCRDQSEAIARAGFRSVSFSIDGPSKVHDALRCVPNCLDRVLSGAEALSTRGVRIGAVTQVNRLNLHELEETHEMLVENHFEGWQVQLTVPYGRAADQPGLCLRPEDLPELEAILLRIIARTPLFVQAADTIGLHEPVRAAIENGLAQGEPSLGRMSGRPAHDWGDERRHRAGLPLDARGVR
jgi:MoaA/NifB/PqqE/SkfB family radical SAM enzyme